MLVALAFKVTKSSSCGNPRDGNEMTKELAIVDAISSQSHCQLRKYRFAKRKTKHRFDVFLDSLFRKYNEEELNEFLASVQLTTYRIKRAKKIMLSMLLGLDLDIEKCMGEIEYSNRNIKFRYYSKFVNNLFTCFVNMVHLHQGLSRRIPRPHMLFHGTTTTFLPNIAKQGLLLCKAGQNWEEDKDKKFKKVCLTDSLYSAEFFALFATQKFGGQAIVLGINVKGLEERMRIMCETLVEDSGVATVFERYFEFFFTEPIPPDRIKILYILPKLPAYALFYTLVRPNSVTEQEKTLPITE